MVERRLEQAAEEGDDGVSQEALIYSEFPLPTPDPALSSSRLTLLTRLYILFQRLIQPRLPALAR